MKGSMIKRWTRRPIDRIGAGSGLAVRLSPLASVIAIARSSNSEDNTGSPLKYSTARFTNDELVGPKTSLRVAVLRGGLRERSQQYRGHRLARSVAASGLLQRRGAEPDYLVRYRAEGSSQKEEAVGSHRIRLACHHEAGRWCPW